MIEKRSGNRTEENLRVSVSTSARRSTVTFNLISFVYTLVPICTSAYWKFPGWEMTLILQNDVKKKKRRKIKFSFPKGENHLNLVEVEVTGY